MIADKKTDIIIARILKDKTLNISTFLKGELRRDDLQSLMLKLYENIANKTKIKDIFSQYKESRFLNPCDISQRELLQFDNLLYSVIPAEFEALELSPVTPFGTNCTLTKVSQKNILSSVRNIEVLADITTVLALECARKRKNIIQNNHLDSRDVHVCSIHRSIRLQKFPDQLGFTPHFKVFGACSAGRDIGHEKFESENLIRHTRMYLELLNTAIKYNYLSEKIAVYISDIRLTEKIIELSGIDREIVMANTQTKGFDLFKVCKIDTPDSILSIEEFFKVMAPRYNIESSLNFLVEIEKKSIGELKKMYPGINFQFDFKRVAGIGYYESLCFKITAENKNGEVFPLVDGGITDWTKKLLGNKKERLFISGFGNELFCRNFKG